ncbi:MAG: MetQ/NlpA family ABC transporter substrate-binding protein [Eubacterium sp.]|nr:MetQ/NlpA family ABC transporter substrate-binding protein [Eubacterium sp.]
MRKKFIGLVLTLSLAAALLTGCGSSDSSSNDSDKAAAGQTEASTAVAEATETDESSEDKVIKVGACVTPHAEILEQIKDNLAEEGWTLEVVEYNDYVLPNTALEDGDLDANYFQHKPYLDDFNAENGTHIVTLAAVHFEPMGVYAGKSSDLSNVPDGATIAVPNDTTNEARALLLLEAQGLIKLKDGVGIEATVLDIEENTHNIEIQELEAAQVAKSIQDVDFAVINGNYAIEAGLDSAIAVEAADSLAAETYANYVCVKDGEENSEKSQALKNAILTQEVKDYINNTYSGAVVPVF